MNKPKLISINERQSKVTLEGLAPSPDPLPLSFLDRFPDILAARDLKEIVLAVRRAREADKPVILTFGAHVIKCGLSRVLCRLLQEQFIKCIGTNGASVIHDVELSLFGHTSEEVGAGLLDGSFGTTEETINFVNNCVNNMRASGLGYGDSIGYGLGAQTTKRDLSVFVTAYRYRCKSCVHVTMGADVNHIHTSANGANIGAASMQDFSDFCYWIDNLADGGVLLNFGSAVTMPEVILKAIAISRARGTQFKDIVMADFDMNRQYRSQTRIVDTANLLGGRGYSITGHHELILPLLGGLLLGT